MPLPAGAVIEIIYSGDMHGQRFMNTLHIYVAAVGDTPSIFDELDNIRGYYSDEGVGSALPAYLQCIPENAAVTSVSAQQITPTRSRRTISTLTETGLGGTSDVTNVQASITFRTNFGGRDQVGGMRIPAAPSNAVAGSWNDPYKVALTSLADVLKAGFTEPGGTAIYQPCIFHRNLGSPANRTDITDAIVQPTTRVIRRRTVGVGV